MDFKFIQSRIQKYYLVTASVLVIFGMLHSQNIYGSTPDFQKNYLTKLDAELNSLVDRCSKTVWADYKTDCTNELEDAWWNDCAFDYDKLDTCKNGKIENFLKSQGRPT